MEISGIRSSLPFLFPNGEKDAVTAPKSAGDVVDIQQPQLLADDEVDGVLEDSIRMIGEDGAAALSAHSLSPQRVFALLEI